MDQHEEKEAENKSRDSTEQREEAAAGEEEDTPAEESMDQGAGHKAEESAGLLIKEVGSGEGSSSPTALFAHPCSLLQLLLRACAGCLGLHGYCGSDDLNPPAAVDAASDSSREGEGGGDKANQQYYMQGEVITRVWAVRRPRPPGRPREGSGGNGGVIH